MSETIMVHLDHPCREIDVWITKSDSDFKAATNQGYIPLEYLRKAFGEYERIRKIIITGV